MPRSGNAINSRNFQYLMHKYFDLLHFRLHFRLLPLQALKNSKCTYREKYLKSFICTSRKINFSAGK